MRKLQHIGTHQLNIFPKLETAGLKPVVSNDALLTSRDRLIQGSSRALALCVHGRPRDNPIIQSAASGSERPTKRACMPINIASGRNPRKGPKRNSIVCQTHSANKTVRMTEAQADDIAAIHRLKLNRIFPLPLPSDAPT